MPNERTLDATIHAYPVPFPLTNIESEAFPVVLTTAYLRACNGGYNGFTVIVPDTEGERTIRLAEAMNFQTEHTATPSLWTIRVTWD